MRNFRFIEFCLISLFIKIRSFRFHLSIYILYEPFVVSRTKQFHCKMYMYNSNMVVGCLFYRCVFNIFHATKAFVAKNNNKYLFVCFKWHCQQQWSYSGVKTKAFLFCLILVFRIGWLWYSCKKKYWMLAHKHLCTMYLWHWHWHVSVLSTKLPSLLTSSTNWKVFCYKILSLHEC